MSGSSGLTVESYTSWAESIARKAANAVLTMRLARLEAHPVLSTTRRALQHNTGCFHGRGVARARAKLHSGEKS
jgi:hypothetical protein